MIVLIIANDKTLMICFSNFIYYKTAIYLEMVPYLIYNLFSILLLIECIVIKNEILLHFYCGHITRRESQAVMCGVVYCLYWPWTCQPFCISF